MAFVRVAAEQQLVLAGLQSLGDGGVCLKLGRRGKKKVCAMWKLLRDVLRLREVLITSGSFVLQRVLFLKVNVPAEVECLFR